VIKVPGGLRDPYPLAPPRFLPRTFQEPSDRGTALVSSIRVARNDYAAGTIQPRHDHAALQVSVVLRGSLEESVGGRVASAAALDVVWKDAGLVHADRFGQRGASLLQLTLAVESLSELVEPGHPTIPWGWRHDPAAARAVLRLATTGAHDGPLTIEHPAVIDLVVRLTRSPATGRGTPPAWLARVAEMIREHDGAALTVSELAAEAGVHPVHLARCFRRFRGTGVAEELRRVRLAAAARDLGESHDSASRIAHRHGYADHPHFCRDFRRAVGVAPDRFRRIARGATLP